MSRIEDAAARPRALRDEELDAVNGGDSKLKRFSVELYVEKMTFNIKEYDA
jgi:hypothetical protein